MIMKWLGPLINRFRIGRFRDWYRFQWAKFLSPGTITAANLPMIDPPFRLRMSPGSKLVIGENVRFYSGFSAYIERDAVVTIGDRTLFNVNCWLGAIEGLTIGSDCMFAPMASITDGNHRYGQGDVPISQQGFDNRDVVVGDDVWVGAKATVINSIGSSSVIGANAVVTREIPEGSVAVGVPARVVASTRPV